MCRQQQIDTQHFGSNDRSKLGNLIAHRDSPLRLSSRGLQATSAVRRERPQRGFIFLDPLQELLQRYSAGECHATNGVDMVGTTSIPRLKRLQMSQSLFQGQELEQNMLVLVRRAGFVSYSLADLGDESFPRHCKTPSRAC